ncbi:MAG: glycosyltransferase family 4 protein [Chloroflexi bacterium]|nr:glycosyltransferase family 4 protein [Chloroflexota bacterium]
MLVGIDASRALAHRSTGTEVYSRSLIEALCRLDSPHQFRLYAPGPLDWPLPPGAEVRAIPLRRMWTHARLSWEMLCSAPDVLFVPAHVVPLLHPQATVVTVHDLGYLVYPEAHPLVQRVYLDLSTRWNTKAARLILADSAATKADLMSRYRTPADKIVVVYPGVSESLRPVSHEAAVAAALGRYGITGEYFLYLGTLQPRKNLTTVVDAFAALANDLPPSVSLVLGGKAGWFVDSLHETIRRHGLEGRVLLPGYIAESDKAALLTRARAFVFPSLYEGFGLPVLEAQACGCPVVTSSTSSLPEAAGEGALLVDPHDTRAIAEAMGRLWTDDELRRDLIQRGWSNVARFSWRAAARLTLSALERAASVSLDSSIVSGEADGLT